MQGCLFSDILGHTVGTGEIVKKMKIFSVRWFLGFANQLHGYAPRTRLLFLICAIVHDFIF